MKQLIGLFIFGLIISGCGNGKCKKNIQPEEAEKTTMIIGGDSDNHGCKASAGYQWSVLKKDCIRPFELPVKIYSADSTTQTGLIFSEDRSQAEIFATNGHYLMNKKMEFQYESADEKSPAKLNMNSKGQWVFEVK
jgi:hypothetical protein